jgi:hypothetical protein
MFQRKAKWLAAMAKEEMGEEKRLQLAYRKPELLETAKTL